MDISDCNYIAATTVLEDIANRRLSPEIAHLPAQQGVQRVPPKHRGRVQFVCGAKTAADLPRRLKVLICVKRAGRICQKQVGNARYSGGGPIPTPRWGALRYVGIREGSLLHRSDWPLVCADGRRSRIRSRAETRLLGPLRASPIVSSHIGVVELGSALGANHRRHAASEAATRATVRRRERPEPTHPDDRGAACALRPRSLRPWFVEADAEGALPPGGTPGR